MSVRVHIEQYATVIGGTGPGGATVGVVQFQGPLRKGETVAVTTASQLYALDAATRYLILTHSADSDEDAFADTGTSSTTVASGTGILLSRNAGMRPLIVRSGATHLVLTPDAG
jgi:hypothetical protein